MVHSIQAATLTCHPFHRNRTFSRQPAPRRRRGWAAPRSAAAPTWCARTLMHNSGVLDLL